MNIVSMAMGYLAPKVVSKIAKSMGIPEGIATSLIGMALPSILGGLTGSSRSSAGAGALFDAVSKMTWGGGNSNPLEAALDVGGAADFAQSGGGMLAGLMGEAPLEKLAGTMATQSGVDAAHAGSMIGMLGPIALGSLRDKVDADGLDAAGLAQFLGDQTGNVAQSMPAGFADSLGGSGLLDSLGGNFGAIAGGLAGAAGVAGATASGMAESATGFARSGVSGAVDAAQGAAGAVGNAAHGAADATTGALREAVTSGKDAVDNVRSGPGIWPWVIIGLLAAAIAWYFIGRPDSVEVAVPDVSQSIMVGDVNLSDKLSTSLDGFSTAMGSITDADSATAALPQLEAFGGQLDEIGGLAANLPESAQGVFGGLIGGALSTVQPLIENVMGMAGVGDAVGPILQTILGKLTALAG